MRLTRRSVLASAVLPLTAAQPGYRVGITTNIRGGWENDVFLSFREARQAGYRHVESFIHYFTGFFNRPEDLLARTREIGVDFVTISNGSPLEMRFHETALSRIMCASAASSANSAVATSKSIWAHAVLPAAPIRTSSIWLRC